MYWNTTITTQNNPICLYEETLKWDKQFKMNGIIS